MVNRTRSHRCEPLEARLLLAAGPIPQTTGPYTVGIYFSVQLDASASTDADPNQSLSFAWDLDNDNLFGETGSAAVNGDESGAMPTFLANGTPPGTYPIKLKVTDSSGLSSDRALPSPSATTSSTAPVETIRGGSP